MNAKVLSLPEGPRGSILSLAAPSRLGSSVRLQDQVHFVPLSRAVKARLVLLMRRYSAPASAYPTQADAVMALMSLNLPLV